MAVNNKIKNSIVNTEDISFNKKYSKVANLHKYWARKPWYVIEGFIDEYSKVGDLVLDPFCGSGSMGYESTMKNRKFIGYDLNPLACFLSEATIKDHFNSKDFTEEYNDLKDKVENLILKNYKTNYKCSVCGRDKYVISSYVGPFYKKRNESDIACLSCSIAKTKEKKIVSDGGKISISNKLWVPDTKFPVKFYKDRFSYKGINSVKDFFTKRSLYSLALLYDSIFNSNYKYKHLFQLAFSNTLLHVSILKAPNVRPLSVNNYWIPDDYIEENVWWRFNDRAKNVLTAKESQVERKNKLKIREYGDYKIYNKSSLRMTEIKDQSVDYLITDPPYGDAIQYSELSYIWNAWLSKEYNIKEEVIINPVQNKGHKEFINQIRRFIIESHRVLKPNKYFTLCFQNKNIQIWNEIVKIIKEVGFDLIDVKVFDTFGSPYNKHWAKFSPKSDLYVTFKKINRHKKTNKTKNIYVEDIIENIVNDFKGDKKQSFDLNRAYDLFIVQTIYELFNDKELVNCDNLQLKDVVNIFENIYKYGNIQQRIL
jgi:hypothetical protein